jgi:2-isopropylmalate synthase
VDIINLALNMFTHGIDPKLEINQINNIKHVYEKVTKLKIDERHPYVGKLVFTAFSGSHQDAINKGMQAHNERKSDFWEIPYLPIDPSDLGRQYEPIVRINSQSGKGGVAYVMENIYGFRLPKKLQIDFSKTIQDISEKEGEIPSDKIYDLFSKEYIDLQGPISFVKYKALNNDGNHEYEKCAEITIMYNGKEKIIYGNGNGPIDALKNAFNNDEFIHMHLLDYSEHALTSGSSSRAAAYVFLRAKGSPIQEYGVGIHSNITTATIKALISAMNRIYIKMEMYKLENKKQYKFIGGKRVWQQQ